MTNFSIDFSTINNEILFVEESFVKIEPHINILKKAGFIVNVASSGTIALNSLKNIIPTLIIINVELTDTDSFELYKKIKSNPKSGLTTVVFFSSTNNEVYKTKALNAGAADYFTLQLNLEIFLARINTLLTLKNHIIKSENQFRELLSSINLISLIIDLKGNVSYCNDYFVNLTHWKKLEIIGKNWFDNFVPKEISKILKMVFADAIKLHEIDKNHENPILDKDGNQLLVLWNNTFLYDEFGKITGVASIGTDITDKRKTEESMRKSKLRLNRAELVTKSGNWELDIKTLKVKASQGAIVLYGLDKKRLDYEEIKYLPLPEYRPMMDLAIKNLIEKDKPYDIEFKIKTADTGEIKDIHSTAFFDKGKGILFGIIQDITETKKMEKTQRESENFFQLIFEESIVSKIVTAPNGNFIHVNKAFSTLIGYEISEIEQFNLVDITHPDDLAISKEVIRCLLAKERKNYRIEKRYIHKNGSIIWVDLNTTLVFNTDGSPDYFINSAVDITKRKIAEEIQLESENKFRSITEQTSDLIAITDNQGIISYASPACIQLFRMKPEEMCGRNFVEFLDKGYIQKAVTIFKDNVQTGEKAVNLELLMKRKDGTTFEGELNGSNFTYNNIEGKLVTIRDISLRKESEKRIIESEQKFRVLFADNPQPMLVYDLETMQILEVNQTGIDFYGYTRDEFQTMTIDNLHPSDEHDYLKELMEETKQGKNTDGIFKHRKKNGEIIFIETNTVSAPAFGPNARHVLIKDITERKLAESEIQKSLSLLNATIESTANGILVVDLEGHVSLYNQIFAKMWEIPNELIQEKRDDLLLSYIIPTLKNPDEFFNKVTQLYKNPELSSNDEIELLDGRVLERFSIPQLIGDSIVGRVWSFTDISERKINLEKLEESERFFRQSQQAGKIGSYHLDMTTGFWNSSDVLDDIFGIDKHYIRNVQGWVELVAEADRDTMNDYFTNYVLGKRLRFNKEYRVSRKSDDKVLWVLGLGELIIKDNVITAMIGTIQDITDRKTIEQELDKKMNDLIRYQNVSVGRELVMINLKKEINDMLLKLGQAPKYTIVG